MEFSFFTQQQAKKTCKATCCVDYPLTWTRCRCTSWDKHQNAGHFSSLPPKWPNQLQAQQRRKPRSQRNKFKSFANWQGWPCQNRWLQLKSSRRIWAMSSLVWINCHRRLIPTLNRRILRCSCTGATITWVSVGAKMKLNIKFRRKTCWHMQLSRRQTASLYRPNWWMPILHRANKKKSFKAANKTKQQQTLQLRDTTWRFFRFFHEHRFGVSDK